MSGSLSKKKQSNLNKIIRIVLGGVTLLLGVFLVGCSSSRVSSSKIQTYEDIDYQRDAPQQGINAIGKYNGQNDAIISLRAELVPSSLTSFSGSDDKKSVAYKYSIRVTKENGEVSNVVDTTITDTLNIKKDYSYYRLDKLSKNWEFKTGRAGEFTAEVSLTDLKSNKTSTRSLSVSIPPKRKKKLYLSDIELVEKKKGREGIRDFNPVITYNVSSSYKVKAKVQVSGRKKRDSLKINTKLYRFQSDTDPARKMNAPNYAISRIEKLGINYNERELILNQQRIIKKVQPVVDYEIELDLKGEGNYRLIISIGSENKGIDFGVKSVGFPFLKKTKDLARPLYYIMKEKEYENLMNISDSDSLKRAVDRFWLKNIGNANKASELINLYYTRVEEANKYFSNYKAGWKTDRGMVYILFGRPPYTAKFFNYIRWAYDTNQYDPETTFIFNKERIDNSFFPFNVYILDRGGASSWEKLYNIIRKWRNGTVLN